VPTFGRGIQTGGLGFLLLEAQMKSCANCVWSYKELMHVGLKDKCHLGLNRNLNKPSDPVEDIAYKCKKYKPK
jgi:hypothetical protein